MTLVDCKRHIANVRWILFWVILMQIISEYLVLTVSSFLPFDIHEYVLIGVKEILTFLPPLFLYVRFKKNATLSTPIKEYRLNEISLFNAILIAVMAIGGQFIMMLLNAPMNMLLETFFHKEIVSAVPATMNVWEFIIGLIFMAAFPAVLEEFWMRGIVFGAFANYSTRAAWIFTTLIFALLHAKFSQVLGILFLGFMTGYVLIKTNSLAASIVYHFFSNATALIAGHYVAGITTAKGIFILFGIFILIFIISFMLFSLVNRKRKTVRGKYDFSLAIGSLLCLPVFLAIIMVVANGYIYNLV